MIVDYEPICATESSSYCRGIRESIVCFTVVVACAMDKIFVECVITKSEKTGREEDTDKKNTMPLQLKLIPQTPPPPTATILITVSRKEKEEEDLQFFRVCYITLNKKGHSTGTKTLRRGDGSTTCRGRKT